MIFYFSGTGNSAAIAQYAARALNDRAVDLIRSDPQAWNQGEDSVLGFVFPVYAYAAPEPVLDFVKQIVRRGEYVVGICTYSNVVGDAMRQFSEILPLNVAYGIKMPDNFPVLDHIIDTEELCLEKLAMGERRLKNLLPILEQRGNIYDVEEGNAQQLTYTLAPEFNRSLRQTKPFRVTDGLCISCGLCEKLCPAGAIRMENGKPVWIRAQCYMCMSCINRCPKTAIEYGPYSEGRFRYWFRGFDPSRYFKQK